METTDELAERIRLLEWRDDQLRETGASTVELEANRLEIVALQWELARRLLAPAEPLERAA